MRLVAEFGLIGALTAAAAWAGSTAVPTGPGDAVPTTAPTRIVAGSVHSAEVLLEISPRERIAAVHVLAADARYSAAVEQAQGLLAPRGRVHDRTEERAAADAEDRGADARADGRLALAV